jgi:hypothetical protein
LVILLIMGDYSLLPKGTPTDQTGWRLAGNKLGIVFNMADFRRLFDSGPKLALELGAFASCLEGGPNAIVGLDDACDWRDVRRFAGMCPSL